MNPPLEEDWVDFEADPAHVARERKKARELKKTAYFQNLFNRGICYYCKNHFRREELTIDHIVPLARGGRSTRGNMVVCCLKCNQDKKHLTPAEMLLAEDNASL
ncbi:MAG: HNH endonuclease [Victivallaceae bacterium]|nr:HNH endonuclease [Victivallaceae bacterium]